MYRFGVLVIFFLFVFVSIGALFYFQIKNSTPEVITKSAVSPGRELHGLLDECALFYQGGCQPSYGTTPRVFLINNDIVALLRKSDNQTLLNYVEKIDDPNLMKIFHKKDDPGKNFFTVPNIIGFVSDKSDINYRTLITLLQLLGREYWTNVHTLPNQPFDSNQDGFYTQLASLSGQIREDYLSIHERKSVNVSGKDYPFSLTLNPASKLIYTTLAVHATSIAEFEGWIDAFTLFWKGQFGTDPTNTPKIKVVPPSSL